MPLQLFHTGVSSMTDIFNKKVETHQNAQKENPFSSQFDESYIQKRRLSKDDEDYGKPLPGSKSEKRALAAQAHVMMEIKYLIEMIWDIKEWRSPDGRAAVTFGKLFNLYIAISDKVVGTLLRARKHGFVIFEGEMLFQRKDDKVVIELRVPYNTIRKSWGLTPVHGGGEALDMPPLDEGISRRNSVGSKSIPACTISRRNSVPPKLKLSSPEEHSKPLPGEPPELKITVELPKENKPDKPVTEECSAEIIIQDYSDSLPPSDDESTGQTLEVPHWGRSKSPTPSMEVISEDEEDK